MSQSQNLISNSEIAQMLHQIIDEFDSYEQAHALITHSRLYKPLQNGKIEFSSSDLIVQLVYTFKSFKNEFLELVEPAEPAEPVEPAEPADELYKLLEDVEPADKLYNELQKSISPDVFKTYEEVKNAIKSDYMMAFCWSGFCRFVRDLIKTVSAKDYNLNLEPEKLYLLFAIHQVFEGFKAAHYDFLHELLVEPETVEFVDVETIPYHKKVHPVVPHGVKLTDFIKNFMLYDVGPYTHHLFMVKSTSGLGVYKIRLPLICNNLLNDIGFYIRFYPSCNLQNLLSRESKKGGPEFNIHTLGLTKKAMLKRFNQ